MSFQETLSGFFADFAGAATLQGTAVPSGVIFDGNYVAEFATQVDGFKMIATVIDSEVPAIAQGQTLVIAPTPRLNVPGGTYIIRNVQPDGTGLSVLELEEQ